MRQKRTLKTTVCPPSWGDGRRHSESLSLSVDAALLVEAPPFARRPVCARVDPGAGPDAHVGAASGSDRA